MSYGTRVPVRVSSVATRTMSGDDRNFNEKKLQGPCLRRVQTNKYLSLTRVVDNVRDKNKKFSRVQIGKILSINI